MNRWTRYFYPSAIVILFVLISYRLLLINSFSLNISFTEDYQVSRVLHISSELYSDPENFPYEINQYTPFYFLVLYELVEIFDFEPAQKVRMTYIFGRSIVLVAQIIAFVIIFYSLITIFKWSRIKAFFLVVILFLLLGTHYTSVRADGLALPLVMMGLVYLFKYLKQQNRLDGFLSSLLIGLAILTRQDMVLYLLFSFILIFFLKDIKSALLHLMIVIAICTAGLVFTVPNLEILTSNLINGVAQGISLSWFIEVIVKEHWFYLLSLLLFMVLNTLLLLTYNLSRFLQITFVTLVCITIIGLLGMLKWGGDVNYIFPQTLMLIIWFAHVWKFINAGVAKPAGVILVFFIFAGLVEAGKITAEPIVNNVYYHNRYVKISTETQKIQSFLGDYEKAYIASSLMNYAIFLNPHSFFGALYNEYPEIYFPDLVNEVGSTNLKSLNFKINEEFFHNNQIFFLTDNTVSLKFFKSVISQLNISLVEKEVYNVDGVKLYQVSLTSNRLHQ